MTGLLRAEWVMARYGQLIPTNWSNLDFVASLDQFSPLGYMVADARNLCVRQFLLTDSEWLVFIDHDVILPVNFYQSVNERIIHEKIPVWSGLYFTKSVPAEPLVYKQNGNGYFPKWKMGDRIWTCMVPMGCTVIHRSIMDVLWNESDEYRIGSEVVRRVFETPSKIWADPISKVWQRATGTEDFFWCDRIVKNDVFTKAGWSRFANKRHPFLVDTSLFCRHIDMGGIQYPAAGEEKFFER